MKRIVVAILVLSMTAFAHAEEKKVVFDEPLVELCNQVMMNIFQDIMAVKSKHKELANFDESALSKNEYGIYQIIYQSAPIEKKKYSQITPYNFGLTIDQFKDEHFPGREGMFNFGFPLLGIKFTGYQKKHLVRSQLDITPFIQDRGLVLADYQQEKMPLRLTIEPTKELFNVREKIVFKVTLTNVTDRHMAIRDPDEKTLYFLIGNEVWGAVEYEDQSKPLTKQQRALARAMRRQRARQGRPEGDIREERDRVEDKRILRAGESVSIIYQGGSFLTPKEMDVYCAYRMSFEGVFPTDTTTIKVVEPLEGQSPAPVSPEESKTEEGISVTPAPAE